MMKRAFKHWTGALLVVVICWSAIADDGLGGPGAGPLADLPPEAEFKDTRKPVAPAPAVEHPGPPSSRAASGEKKPTSSGKLVTELSADFFKIAVGDDKGAVISRLGNPMGKGHVKSETRNFQLLLYEPGFLRIESNEVVQNDFMTAADYALRKEQEAARKTARMQLSAAGTAERKRISKDPYYVGKSAMERVQIWNHFRQTYPGVAVDEALYGLAVRELSAERRKAALDKAASEVVVEPARISGRRIRKLKRAGKWDSETKREKVVEAEELK
jgi:hypothetical protein